MAIFLKALSGLSLLASLAAATPSEVLAESFADPSIIYDPASGDWYAFATAGNNADVQIASAPSSTGPWTLLDIDLLPNGMGSWAVDGKKGGWEAGVMARRMAGGASVEEYLAIFASLPHGSAGRKPRSPSAPRDASY